MKLNGHGAPYCRLCNRIVASKEVDWDAETNCHKSCMEKEVKRRLKVMYLMSVLLVLLVPACANAYPPSIQQNVDRCMFVETEEEHGTGVIVKPFVLATVFHALQPNSKTKVNGDETEVLKVDPERDLAYLRVKSDTHPIEYADVDVGDEVYYVGNPGPHKCVVVRGVVVEKNDDHIYFDGTVFPGASGAGLYDSKGRLVGLMDQLESSGIFHGFGIAIPSRYVKKGLP